MYLYFKVFCIMYSIYNYREDGRVRVLMQWEMVMGHLNGNTAITVLPISFTEESNGCN